MGAVELLKGAGLEDWGEGRGWSGAEMAGAGGMEKLGRAVGPEGARAEALEYGRWMTVGASV